MEGHRRSFPIIRFIFKVRKLLVGLWVVAQSNFDWTGSGTEVNDKTRGLSKTAGKCCVVYGNKIKSHKHGIKWYVQ